MRNFLLKLLSVPPATPPDGLAGRVAKLERDLSELHRRLLAVEGEEAVREASHAARMDALARLYKRVSQRFVDSPGTNPSPVAVEPSVLEMRRKLGK